MLLIPAIDIRHGACVRLLRGDFSDVTVYDENPLAIAQEYGRLGSSLLHIVDLDGAEAGKPVNHELVGQIAKTAGCPIQTGGGLRDLAGV
ncbi:MAG: 1-(5-phosphoribosyl)-5-((5-phosphoribosylamino)methylideneamino)imidazole-4-carboxamide isomerase, partial [Gammaproteobacteria bacterium]|nr:1-(5-phosphoribosyl)-5-((5-phosphoribosylamino)methylideneamino)imidazole-4-carboxamide isomerase [Gammaproteobacteria bacterium]